jgi:DNA-binding transcriptional regulator of glucitol operon
MSTPFLLLAAVVLGWFVQLFLSYRQSMAFNDDVRRLRHAGTVSVGAGGRRYRGGRAFVGLAFDERGVVQRAIGLSGFSTFARAKPLPGAIGLKASQLRGEREVPGLTRQQRDAARQAAELLTALPTRKPDQQVLH